LTRDHISPRADGVLFADDTIATVPVANRNAKVAVRRIFCLGRNYAAHTREMGKDPQREPPFFFMKPASSLVASPAQVPYPPQTADFHYEMELVVALGKPVSDGSREAAASAVFGYAAGIDFTRRDLQLAARNSGLPWELGKSFENSAAVGPIKAVEDLEAPLAGYIRLSVNGTLKQDGVLKDMIWPVPEIIANLSRYFHLRPGDLIFTGTPAGVGAVVPGDILRGQIQDIGEVVATIGPIAARSSDRMKS
jgi:fumarylpyruvate hydrolase